MKKKKIDKSLEQLNSLKKTLKNYKEVNIQLKSKDNEFFGLYREFDYYQADMINEYKRNNDVKHPRDNGDLKENDIRTFLSKKGFIPAKYGISENGIRIASSSGHISKEMDIVFYDSLNNFNLMNRKERYKVFPVETVYGVMQVKSKLNKKELKSGFENIASFKMLKKQKLSSVEGLQVFDNTISQKGFGILFAYDSDMDWVDVVNEYENFAKINPNTEWCNCIVILNQGIILPGDERMGCCFNNFIETITEPKMYGNPDTSNNCLLQLYNIIIKLLIRTGIQIPDVEPYCNLPLISGHFSYSFTNGDIDSFYVCKKHGPYLKKIKDNNLDEIMKYINSIEPINWIQATDIAYGNEQDIERYKKQPEMVYIYNPENLEYKDILIKDCEFQGKQTKSLASESIVSNGKLIWLPEYYIDKYGIFDYCPQCIKELKKKKSK